MKTASYYLNPINERYDHLDLNFGSREALSLPLVVNCAGYVNANYSHTNFNPSGRLDYYLIYLVSGKIEFFYEGKAIELRPGSLIIYPPRVPYKYSCITNGEDVQFFWVHFTGSAVEDTLSKYKLSLFPSIHEISINNHIDARFKSIFDAFAINDSLREDELSAHISRLLIEIARVVAIKGSGIGRLHKSVRYINEHFSEEIRITDLARLESMCMTTYNLHFKRYMGITPTKYIIKLRMQHAVELLLNSELSIKEISSRCGYNDYNLFTKMFKGEIGMTPTKYRKSFKRH